MNAYSSFIKDNRSVLLGHILVDMRGIFLMPLIIKTVGVTIYGGYALLASLLGILFGISSFGVSFRCKRFLPSAQDKQTRQELFYPQMFFQIATISFIALLFILIGPKIKSLFFKNEVGFSIILGALYLFTYLPFSQTNDYLRYTGRVRNSMIQSIVFSYLHIFFVLIIYFFLHDININLLISSQILTAVLVSAPLIPTMLKEIGLTFPTFKIRMLADDIKLGFPLVLSYIVDVVLSSSDRYVIALLLSVTAVGYYNPGYALGTFIALFPKASGMVLPQLLSKSVDQGKEEEARTMLNYTLKGFLLLAIPFVVGSGVLSKPLLIILANAEVAEKAHLVTPIVALGTLFYGINAILSNVLFVRMKTAAMFKMNVFAAILNLFLNFILLYIFKNILVAAITTFLSYFVVFIFIRRIVVADWRVNFHLETIAKSIGASIFMGVLLAVMSSQLGTNAYRAVYIFIEIGFGMIIYFAALFALKTFSPKELSYLNRAFSWGRVTF